MSRIKEAALSPAFLRELLIYQPETGQLHNAVRRGRAQKGQLVTLHTSDGYLRVTVLRRTLLAHRVAWAMHYGEWPKGELDHVNGVRDDNRIDNLREATSQENSMNRGKYRNNTSGYKGVTWDASRSKWLVAVSKGGKREHVGRYDDLEVAVCAYKTRARILHGGFHRESD